MITKGGTDLHDHEGDAVWVRPAGALEGHSKVNVGHVWFPDSHIGASPEERVLQDSGLIASVGVTIHSAWLVTNSV